MNHLSDKYNRHQPRSLQILAYLSWRNSPLSRHSAPLLVSLTASRVVMRFFLLLILLTSTLHADRRYLRPIKDVFAYRGQCSLMATRSLSQTATEARRLGGFFKQPLAQPLTCFGSQNIPHDAPYSGSIMHARKSSLNYLQRWIDSLITR